MEFQITKTFEEWCLENNYNELLLLWDYSLNIKKPNEIGFTSNKKYYFKCKNSLHKSYEIKLNYLSRSIVNIDTLCPYCNSVAQEGVNNYGEDFIDKYWSDKNVFSPWEVSRGSNTKKIWLKCPNDDTHPDHSVFAASIRLTVGCPYCSGKKYVKQIL